jgi:hypothetical protein
VRSRPVPSERLLEWLFALEAQAIHRFGLPVGVSVLCAARRRPDAEIATPPLGQTGLVEGRPLAG